jgi:flavin reductase (DIM6/NTAB) family NADH-FMN oxidoreductase RutF
MQSIRLWGHPSPFFIHWSHFLRDVQSQALPTSAEFRKAMGHFPTGVCVVALETDAGEIAAMTINSFVSVSLEPLLICWSLHNSSGRFDLFANAERFTVSILAADQGELAVAYASRELKAVREDDFELSLQGLPVLKGALASFECDAFVEHPAGDHTMILGRVVGLSGPPEAGAQALGFYGGEFIPVPAERSGD